MKKVFMCVMLAVLLAMTGVLGGCGGQDSAAGDKKTVRIGVVPLPHYADAWVAYKKGFLAEELQKSGYELDWHTIALGPVVSEAFAAGEIDMGVMGDFPAFIGRSAGTNFCITSVASTAPEALALIVRPDSPVKSMADLKGKKVATTKAAYGQKLLALLVEQAGMKMEDISFISLSMPDLAAALARGDIDAGVVWDPILTKLESSGEARVVADGTGLYDAYAVWMATDELAKNDREAVRAVMRARQKGVEYMQEHPEEASRLLLEEINLPSEQFAIMLKKFSYEQEMTDKFYQDMQDTEEFMYSNGLLKGKVDVNAFIVKP